MKTESKSTIAIKNLNGKSFAIDAEITTIHGFTIGVHRSVKGSGWAATFVGKAIAAAVISGGTKQAVLDLATSRIERAGASVVQAKLDALPDAEPLEGLPRWEAPVKVTVETANIDGIVKIIGDRVDLNDGERLAVRNALNSRTGRLKAKAPSDDWSKAAWNGLQPNAWKIQFSACFLRGEPADLLAKLSKHSWPVALDKDLSTLRALGVA